MTETTNLSTTGENAYDRLKRMLDAADIDPDNITGIHLSIEHIDGRADEEVEPADIETDKWVDEETPPNDFIEGVEEELDELAEEVEENEVEYGPTEPAEDDPRGGHGKGGWVRYGSLPEGPFRKADATRPDSMQGRVMRVLMESPNWLTSTELAEEVDIEPQQASKSLSRMFHRAGLTKRRETERGDTQYEYQLTQAGRARYRAGLDIAEKLYEEQKEEMEDGK